MTSTSMPMSAADPSWKLRTMLSWQINRRLCCLRSVGSARFVSGCTRQLDYYGDEPGCISGRLRPFAHRPHQTASEHDSDARGITAALANRQQGVYT
jgi:hypothetical protein